MKAKRLFVAIDVPDSIQRLLVDLDPRIRGVRWVDGGQMHLTLGFFERVPEDVDLRLREKLSAIEFKAFFLPILGLGKFPAKGPPKVVWVGVGAGHPHLFQIYKRVQEAAFQSGLEPEQRPFHPHVTLARCRDVPEGALRKFLNTNAALDMGIFRVESFHLYSSELTQTGPIHTRELTISARE
ncbi:MAG TPA: RNA 2',3'-cyclic phosphodiesterase [Chthoniobacterales bacterium]|jgi:2'-5' RNA ligase